MERQPRTCIWELTRACNLHCVHCDNHAATPSTDELSLTQLLNTADELKTLGCRLVDITGGEPLLRPGWDVLCKRLTDHGIDVVLVSNGTLFTDAALELARQAGVVAVGVSVDGLKTTHDNTRRFLGHRDSAFDAAIAGIRKAQKLFPVTVITQVNQTNLRELPAIGRFLGELKVARWQLQLAIPTPRVLAHSRSYAILPQQLEEVTAFIVAASADPEIPMIHTSDNIGYATSAEAILRRKASGPGLWLGCVAGIRAVAIKYDGTVRGCSLLPSDFCAGNLHNESLKSIWQDASRFAYSTEFAETHLSGGCKSCKFGTICRAGCTTMAYFSTGTTGDNPYCLCRVRESHS